MSEDETEYRKGSEGAAPSVHESKLMFTDECLAGMIVAFDGGDMATFRRLYDEALNERFEAGIEYAKDSVGEWNKP
jgi:hypothetical protein